MMLITNYDTQLTNLVAFSYANVDTSMMISMIIHTVLIL